LDVVVGSEIGAIAIDGGGSNVGTLATGATLLGRATRFLAAFLAGLRATGAALACAFLRAGLRAFFAAFFTTFLALPDHFAARAFFFTALLLTTVRFAFATGRFFALLFFFAMINFLLAVLRLLVVRVALKKSAVIYA
jgi:hypothetical protein